MTFQYRGWCAIVDPSAPPGLDRLEDLMALTRAPGENLKDDHRSLVRRLDLAGAEIVVAKQPRDKNRRAWIRFLSWFRDSEVRRFFDSMVRLRDCGIEAPVPIAALERRRFGMVVDSWLFYFYRAGAACTHDQLSLAAATLARLHRAGLRHDDPHLGNFLFDGRNVILADLRCSRRLGRVSDYYDYLVFERKSAVNDIGRYVDIDRHSWPYRLARAYLGYRDARAGVKLWLRRDRRSRYRRRFESQKIEDQQGKEQNQRDQQDTS